MRGKGLAAFRQNIAHGINEAVAELKTAGMGAEFLLFLEYCDALKYIADHSAGKVIFADSGAQATWNIIKGIQGGRS